jgi:alkylation response protein AidB-like acyl-CoA dehydrogenase
LLENQIVSCFAMTEPQSGSDPLVLKMSAGLDGNEWVINGEKWFAFNVRYASAAPDVIVRLGQIIFGGSHRISARSATSANGLEGARRHVPAGAEAL